MGRRRPPLAGPALLGQLRPAAGFSVLAEATERLDRFLADQLDLSRTQAARLVAAGQVTVNGVAARASRQLVRGDQVEVVMEDRQESVRPIRPLDRPLEVVHEDEHLIVLNKPAGLVVHPAPGHWEGTLVNMLAARGHDLSIGAAGRPGIVHRLDRDTSGLMVVARTDLAHRRLAAALAARRVVRRYAALAWGHFDQPAVTIDAPIGRHPADRKRMAVRPDRGGRSARTRVDVVARFAVTDLLRLTLETGRTHQIRVHLEYAGHPVVGDPTYHGGGSRRISGAARRPAEAVEAAVPRQALHAAELAFRHPVTGAPLRFVAEWPADLLDGLRRAAEPTRIAGPNPLSYLGFFEDPDA